MNKLAYWRGVRKLSVRALSEKSGVEESTINRIEREKVKPHITTLGRLAEALEIDLKELAELAETDPKDALAAQLNEREDARTGIKVAAFIPAELL